MCYQGAEAVPALACAVVSCSLAPLQERGSSVDTPGLLGVKWDLGTDFTGVGLSCRLKWVGGLSVCLYVRCQSQSPEFPNEGK